MRILTIGDLHGRDVWKKFADINFLLNATDPETAEGYIPEFEKYVFVGDYCDSFTETSVIIKHNLLELIRFKTLYPNHVILLWGNHDVPYFLIEPWKKDTQNKYMCSGYRPEARWDLYDIFNKNRDLFQLAYQIKNYIWTHSGIHFGWYHHVFKNAIKDMNMDELNVAEQLNEAFRYRLDCLFDVDWYRGGNKKVGGPLWCDRKLVGDKPLKNTHQIVGHNPVSKILTIDNFSKSFAQKGSTSITFCDVLHHLENYHIIDI